MDIALVLKKVSHTLNKNSPTILTGLGVAGLVSTVVLAVKGTIKARDLYAQEIDWRYNNFEGAEEVPFPTPQEVIELTWKEYIPTAVMGAMTIACMIGSNHISMRRNAALASLFSITETTLREYQTKVVETIGEKKEEKIQSEIAQDKLDANPIENSTVIITGDGDFPCYDMFSGRYFLSTIDKIIKAQNEFNQQLNRDGWRSINHFYDLLGLDDIELGEDMGWYADQSLLEVKQLTKMANGKPCLVLDYYVKPRHI